MLGINRHRLAAAAALAVLGVATLGACGGSEEPDLANGKQLFTQNCASCHTLADAGSKGILGPNLDDAFIALTGEKIVEDDELAAVGD